MKKLVKRILVFSIMIIGLCMMKDSRVMAQENVYATLYRNNTFVGQYTELSAAFNQMTDRNSEYQVILSSNGEFYLPDNYNWPSVKSIELKADGDGRAMVYIAGNHSFNSTVKLDQVWLFTSQDIATTVNFGSHKIILNNEAMLGNYYEASSFIGTTGSVIDIEDSGYSIELHINLNVDKMILQKGMLLFRGINVTYNINEFDYYEGTIFQSGLVYNNLYMGTQVVNINTFKEYSDCSAEVPWGIENATTLNIKNMEHALGYTYALKFNYAGYYQPIAVSDVNITGNMDCIDNICVFLDLYVAEGASPKDYLLLDSVAKVPNFSGTTDYSNYSVSYYYVDNQTSTRVKQELGNIKTYLSNGKVCVDANSFEKTYEQEYDRPTPDSTGTGLQQSSDGNWYYWVNGQIASDYTGLVYDQNAGWWYVRSGVIDFGYNGLIQNEAGWWCVAGGQVRFDYSGLWSDPTVGWWYVENGAINFGYNGLIPNDTGWWCVAGGQVVFDYTGLWNDPTVGWWIVYNGAINFNYNDLYGDANYGWWKVTNGAVDFNYTGLYESPTVGWWIVYKGGVNFDYNDLYGDANYGWWKVTNGAVDFGYNGWYTSALYGDWYINGGAVVF